MKINSAAFESLLGEYQQRVNQALDSWLPGESVNPMELHRAMRYSVLAPGKRVRPVLVYATATALGIDLKSVDGAAAARGCCRFGAASSCRMKKSFAGSGDAFGGGFFGAS